MKSKINACAAIVLFAAGAAVGARPGRASPVVSAFDNLAAIFRPFETNDMTLSPDGRYLAYTERREGDLYLVIRDLSSNQVRRMFVAKAEEGWTGTRGKVPARVTFLRWGADNRLVFNLNSENVWSVAPDGTDARRLADVQTFAAGIVPAVKAIGSTEIVIPPSALDVAQAMEQPVRVGTMLRGDRYVYVEAAMRSRGGAPANFSLGIATLHSPGTTPRVVLRVDAASGKSQEWKEAPESEGVLCDQNGYPRVALRLENAFNARSGRYEYVYADAKSDDWKSLDALVKQGPLDFHFDGAGSLEPHSIPLGFGFDGSTLYFASNVGHDTFGVYALDTRTWRRTAFAVEIKGTDLIDPVADQGTPDVLVFDSWTKKLVGLRWVGALRSTVWFDPTLQRVQHALDANDPARQWEIVEWDRARRTYLVRASSASSPATYCLYRPADAQIDEVMNDAPWLPMADQNRSVGFAFNTKAGVRLTGYFTYPRHSRIKQPPLLVLCHDGPWSRDYPDYNREVQALASMGFCVLQVNYRGSAGFGRGFLDALQPGFDSIALDDIMAAIDAVTKDRFDRRLVAIMGHGYGGYLALRATQLYPKVFRCAIALDAPADLPTWINTPSRFQNDRRTAFFGRDEARLKAISPLANAARTEVPVMLLESDANGIDRNEDLARAMRAAARAVTFVRLSPEESADVPAAHTAVFRRIEDFLNANVYAYAVKIGIAVEVPAIAHPVP